MATKKVVRKDPRRETTRLALLETAESLFGKDGIHSVSLRQIGSAIGSSNANVVGYYFGTKEDLIAAILAHRLPWLESRRRELLDLLKSSGSTPGLADFFHAMWHPLFEQTNAKGEHSFALFLEEIVRSGFSELRRSVNFLYPATNEINMSIYRLLPEEVLPYAERIMGTVIAIISNQLEFIDKMNTLKLADASQNEAIFQDALQMAMAALVVAKAV